MGKNYICPICGYDGLSKEPEASYEICPCCGYEFGTMMYWIGNETYDLGVGDEDAATYRTIRNIWIQHKCPWFREDRRPTGWNMATQLKNIGEDNT